MNNLLRTLLMITFSVTTCFAQSGFFDEVHGAIEVQGRNAHGTHDFSLGHARTRQSVNEDYIITAAVVVPKAVAGVPANAYIRFAAYYAPNDDYFATWYIGFSFVDEHTTRIVITNGGQTIRQGAVSTNGGIAYVRVIGQGNRIRFDVSGTPIPVFAIRFPFVVLTQFDGWTLPGKFGVMVEGTETNIRILQILPFIRFPFPRPRIEKDDWKGIRR